MKAWDAFRRAIGAPKVLEVYSDGSAEGRSGRPGGWAYMLVLNGKVLASRTGAAPSTTSLLMEIEGALAGLREVHRRNLHRTYAVKLLSDSTIALDIAAGRFTPKPHVDLAQTLRATALAVGVTPQWVRAHAGHSWNEAVDLLAREAKIAATDTQRKFHLSAVHRTE